jgi:hypothetical protein
MQALTAARESLYQKLRVTDPADLPEDTGAPTASLAQEQADALLLIAEGALHHGLDAGGRALPDVPAPAPTPDDPVRALRARSEAAGLHLNARTSCPGWLGERLDVRWAIDVLHPRARGEETRRQET